MDVRRAYQELFTCYGPQHWWPRHTGRKRPGFDPRFEIMVGAILTQNTAWTNVERVIDALYSAHLLDPKSIVDVHLSRLRSLIRPTGYFNQKAKKLKLLAGDVLQRGRRIPSRDDLLQLWGIGPETADSILLYAYQQPVFVVDAYTRRFLTAQGEATLARKGYNEVRFFFEAHLPKDPKIYNEYHALIVAWGKYGGKPS